MISQTEFIYLDNNATTPVDQRVLDAILPYLTTKFGNASSTHRFGSALKKDIDNATQSIAELINSEIEEIIYTSGATESINLVLKGIAHQYHSTDCHIITCQTEHKATLDVCQFLEFEGYQVTYLSVDRNGLIDLNELSDSIQDTTRLISIMTANNETGVLQPIEQIGALANSNGILYHTDATQAFGKIPLNVIEQNIDFLSFSAHKLYGPKGSGGLYVANNHKNSILPLIHGGGQQYNLRSGTYNTPGIIGLGEASKIAINEMGEDNKHSTVLRDRLESSLLELPGSSVNGDKELRLPNTSNICFEGLDSDVLISSTPSVAISNGSACTAATPESSYVLKSMGLSSKQAFGSIRFGVGRFNTIDEIDLALEILSSKINQQRELFKVA